MWQEALTSEFLGEPQVKIDQFLLTFGLALGNQSEVFKQAYVAYLKHENSYSYEPMIGAPLVFNFDLEREKVTLQRFEDQAELSFPQFQRYMGLIDLIFSEIYPVGSVVELDSNKLSAEVKAYFKRSESGPLVTIHARRVPSDDRQNYIDYIGTVWPFGMLPDVEPILLNNLLIKRVVSAGLTNDEEKKYVLQVLKKEILLDGCLSTMYAERKRGEVNES